ncbi:helix-turn-helix domain-containing protein [Spirosoma sp. KUDC1026]|uniref:AlbA family DNA-binding domain-containing protein n=1 Tax=Spirosoma sp. KUDC1026 TaxID=2745947 RepID=UPI00159BCC8C|nr:ATP-binding protein [Spirosoma sp. KUDC1026]QKZ15627.1 ATP-binding protein [Spirosoma sp. KUDC1026]
MNPSVMDYQALKNLVRRGEGSNLEFKLKTNHPEKIIKGVVAFANSNGGIMLIGVGDDKRIAGLKYADEDEYLLVRAIHKYCFPRISYTIDRVQLPDEREVLVIRVPPSLDRPHYILPDPAEPETKKVYVRVADKSVQASREVREILKGSQADRNIRFSYGEKERKLMQHLGEHNSITVDLFASIAGISRKIASRTLVLLVLANVLEVHPSDIVDQYTTRVLS